MKIQSLAVIFIIIILPISLTLSFYMQAQIQTLNLQTSYDSKLTNATYDAIKAFQLNTVNSGSSDISASKIRDIEASTNTFFNSIASNFELGKDSEEVLKEYVPALVYTMYDGYYIYSPYTNNIGNVVNVHKDSEYQNGEKLYGLKPYIYYSCEYERSGEDHFVITYTLDNYITIQGYIKGDYVNESGYIIDPNQVVISGDTVTYRGSEISSETLQQEKVFYIDGPNPPHSYQCIKINGIKHYKDSDGWFTVMNGKRYLSNLSDDLLQDDSARQYYINAKKFTEYVLGNTEIEGFGRGLGLENLLSSDAVGISNESGDYKIFDNSRVRLEEPNSNFNQHRLAVIRNSIETNLSIAIANYNNYTSSQNEFQMPKLKENEWDKIVNHVSMISFLQGLPIGGKIYNGYSIVTNNINEEVVSEDSIVIIRNGEYYQLGDKVLEENHTGYGVYNANLERKSVVSGDDYYYYYPKEELEAYSSIMGDVKAVDNVYTYLQDKPDLAKIYYTALARERYSSFKINNN